MNYDDRDLVRPTADETSRDAPAAFVDLLTKSLLQIAHGQVVAIEPVLSSLRASATRIRGERADKDDAEPESLPK